MELEAAVVINREPIGTGPYRFVSYNPTQNILLERFEDYWDVTSPAKRSSSVCLLKRRQPPCHHC